jgi:BMFP domain-containing protein YqiC
MSRQSGFDEFMAQFRRLLPTDLRRYGADLEDNVRAALQAAFARMDLVTRDEFDVQCELLSRTRALLEELERKVAELEKELEQQ